MNNDKNFEVNSQAVQSHLGITQAIIERMAANSSSCKAWCITLVSAILVIVADKGKPDYALIAVIPTALFLVLDTYYLALEKAFRDSYDAFIKKLHDNSLVSEDLYVVSPKGKICKIFFKEALVSISIWPFYLTLFAMILIAKEIVI